MPDYYSHCILEEKKTKGYLKASGAISSESTDIESGVAFGHILNLEPKEQTKAFEEFLENETYKSSVFGTKAQKMLDEGIEEEIIEAITPETADSLAGEAMMHGVESAKEAVEETVEDLGL